MKLNREQHLLVMQLLLKILECDKRLEIAKKTLASDALFEAYDIFKVLDDQRKFYVTDEDVCAFIKQIFPKFKQLNMEYLWHVLAKGSDRLDFDAFAQQILPRDYGKAYKNIYYLNKQSINITPDLSIEIRIDFSNLMKTIHDEALTIDKCIYSLQASGVTGEQLFQCFASHEKGYVSLDDIRETMKGFVHYIGKTGYSDPR